MDNSNRPRVLVADHDRTFLDRLINRLFDMGIDVDFAENGKTALRLVAQGKYDLIIIEIGMPIHNGLEILRAAKRNDTNGPVLIISFRNTEDWAEQAVREGACSYILRPLKDFRAFDREVIKALKSKQQRSVASPMPKEKIPVSPTPSHSNPPQKSRSEVSAPISSLPMGILEINSEGRILSYNPAAKSWLKLEAEHSKQPIRAYLKALRSNIAPPSAILHLRGQPVQIQSKTFAAKDGSQHIGVTIQKKNQKNRTAVQKLAEADSSLSDEPAHATDALVEPSKKEMKQPTNRWEIPFLQPWFKDISVAFCREFERLMTVVDKWMRKFLEAEPREASSELVGVISHRLADLKGRKK